MDEKKVREEDYLEFPWGIEDTIENLRELKSILQKRVREEDCDGKGTQDAFELGFDFDRAIEALEKQLPKRVDFEEDAAENMCVECPSCGSFLGYRVDCLDENYQFDNCKHCDQRLDWSE